MDIIGIEIVIHGNQHYKDRVRANVKYRLQRDSSEPDDNNCVRVLSPDDNAIVANVSRKQARDLAYVMDNNTEKRFFVIREGRAPSNPYRIRVRLLQED